MRASTFLLVACLALLASSALAFRVPARLRQVQDAKVEDPALSPVCLAKCAAESAWCVHECGKSVSAEERFSLTCKQKCAVSAGTCSSKCGKKSELEAPVAEESEQQWPSTEGLDEITQDIMDMSETLAEAAPVGVSPVCLAGCAATTASCIMGCLKSNAAWCKTQCTAQGALCAAGCALKSEEPVEVEPLQLTVPEAEPQQLNGMDIVCVAQCAQDAAVCVKNAKNALKKAACAAKAAVCTSSCKKGEMQVQAELEEVLQVDEPDFELGANVQCLAECAVKAAACKKKASNFIKKAACVAKAAVCVAGCKKSVLAEPEFEEVLLLEQVQEEQPAELGVNVVCLAECASKAVQCKKKAKNFIKKAACAAKAAICVAKCNVKSVAPEFLEVAEAEPVEVESLQLAEPQQLTGIDIVCAAQCAQDAATCVKNAKNALKKAACAVKAGVCAAGCKKLAEEPAQSHVLQVAESDVEQLSGIDIVCAAQCAQDTATCVKGASNALKKAACVAKGAVCAAGCKKLAEASTEVEVLALSEPEAELESVLEVDEPEVELGANVECLAQCAVKAAACKKKAKNFIKKAACVAKAAICVASCKKSVLPEPEFEEVLLLEQVAEEQPTEVGANVVCLAECAAKAVACKKKAKNFIKKAACAAKAAICVAKCSVKSEAPEFLQVAEAEEVTMEAELESVLELEEPDFELGANVECLAQCAVKAAACKKKAKNFIKKAACVAKAAICVASCKKSVLAEPEFEEALQLAETPVALEANVVCLGECAVKAAACKKKAKNFIKKAACVAKAAICVAKCSVKSETPEFLQSVVSAESVIDASNIADFFSKAATDVQFQSFKSEHDKKYETPALEAYRFTLFQENMRQAAELQRLNPGAEFGANQFSDLHPLEFKRMYLNYQPAVGDAAMNRLNVPLTQTERVAAPENFDWRRPDNGRPVAVTPVKDQGRCGSCWAFSAVETVESAFILAGNPATELSTEQVVDCDRVDHGCNGGDTVTAYKYMQGTGLQTEQDYPYTAGKTGRAESCQYKADKIATKVSGFTYATPACFDSCTKQDEELLKENLYNAGPVSICVSASVWQSYKSGILTSASGCRSGYYQLDHCVQLVGYGTDPSGAKFWSARNSWGMWGEAGYIRLAYGANTCGLADEATHVQL